MVTNYMLNCSELFSWQTRLSENQSIHTPASFVIHTHDYTLHYFTKRPYQKLGCVFIGWENLSVYISTWFLASATRLLREVVFFVYYKKRETTKYASHNCITKVKFHGYRVDMVDVTQESKSGSLYIPFQTLWSC